MFLIFFFLQSLSCCLCARAQQQKVIAKDKKTYTSAAEVCRLARTPAYLQS